MLKSYIWPLFVVAAIVGCIERSHDFAIRFDDLLGLQKGDQVFFEETAIGVVEEIESTEAGRYRVDVAVDKQFADKITEASRFYIDAAPGRTRQKAVRVVQFEAGGDPIEEGTVVEGQTKYAVLYGQLAHQLGANLRLLETEFNTLLEALQHFSESDEIKDLERQLDAVIDDLGEMSVEMKRTLEEEVLPLLQKKLEALRKRLEQSGEEDKLDKLDDQMETLTDRIRT